MTFWLDGFISHYAPLYTLYWPLPADFKQFHPLSGAIFITGIALIMVGTLLFVLNIFKTINHRNRMRYQLYFHYTLFHSLIASFSSSPLNVRLSMIYMSSDLVIPFMIASLISFS